jgi:hypothetical protein
MHLKGEGEQPVALDLHIDNNILDLAHYAFLFKKRQLEGYIYKELEYVAR